MTLPPTLGPQRSALWDLFKLLVGSGHKRNSLRLLAPWSPQSLQVSESGPLLEERMKASASS